MKVTHDRWQAAQHYEIGWWRNYATHIDPSFYREFAEEIQELVQSQVGGVEYRLILEVGSGAAGAVTHLQAPYRFALDPLERYYSSVPVFQQARDTEVNYLSAMGEAIPLKSAVADLAIMDNVLDHCENPQQVMSELRRVAAPGRLMFFRQHLFTRWGSVVRAMMDWIRIDPGHPHTITPKSLQQLLTGWEVIYSEQPGFLREWLTEWRQHGWKGRMRALLLIPRVNRVMLLKRGVDD